MPLKNKCGGSGGFTIQGIIDHYAVSADSPISAGDFVEFVESLPTSDWSGAVSTLASYVGTGTYAFNFRGCKADSYGKVLILYDVCTYLGEQTLYNSYAQVLHVDNGTITQGVPVLLTTATTPVWHNRGRLHYTSEGIIINARCHRQGDFETVSNSLYIDKFTVVGDTVAVSSTTVTSCYRVYNFDCIQASPGVFLLCLRYDSDTNTSTNTMYVQLGVATVVDGVVTVTRNMVITFTDPLIASAFNGWRSTGSDDNGNVILQSSDNAYILKETLVKVTPTTVDAYPTVNVATFTSAVELYGFVTKLSAGKLFVGWGAKIDGKWALLTQVLTVSGTTFTYTSPRSITSPSGFSLYHSIKYVEDNHLYTYRTRWNSTEGFPHALYNVTVDASGVPLFTLICYGEDTSLYTTSEPFTLFDYGVSSYAALFAPYVSPISTNGDTLKFFDFRKLIKVRDRVTRFRDTGNSIAGVAKDSGNYGDIVQITVPNI